MRHRPAALPHEQHRALDAVGVSLDRDGAAVARGVVPGGWIALMRAALDAEMAGASPTAAEYGREAERAV
ncbi:MAG TPA: hypothetical protein VG248_05925 [Caulobacteraceae bacterium]|jgi:hypothetical protein|nr:hypothetical protein [Caulobacteraceae bacterium]